MFKFSKSKILYFYLSFIFYKVIIIFECSKGFLTIYLAEAIWLFRAITKQNSLFYLKLPFFSEVFNTKFGKFNINPDLMNIFIVSPAFERQDLNYLMKQIEKEFITSKSILFVDIGASFGKYTIALGNKFKRKKLNIISFEPDAAIYSPNSFSLLKKNVAENKIKNAKLYKIGIGQKNIIKNNVKIKTLASVIGKNNFKKYGAVFIKLDIDDYVIDGLKGIEECVRNGSKTYLFVEDCVKKDKVLAYLRKNKYAFVDKLTPYNSFWLK
ncbi:MAG TPA: hypothetical protein VHE53_00280 [Patescibacteria group bacterium]|nr:hypothetical protein [Patescibacteria group bacterium]